MIQYVDWHALLRGLRQAQGCTLHFDDETFASMTAMFAQANCLADPHFLLSGHDVRESVCTHPRASALNSLPQVVSAILAHEGAVIVDSVDAADDLDEDGHSHLNDASAGSHARAVFDYKEGGNGHLVLSVGDIITVMQRDESGW